jgi:hypothetical protein
MSITILGPCTPGPNGHCSEPLDQFALSTIIESLPVSGREGNVNLIVPGKLGLPWPPGIARAIADFVSRPENRKYGLFHHPESSIIWVNSNTLKKVVDMGLVRPGNYYYQLVYAINAIGLEAVDIAFTPPDHG